MVIVIDSPMCTTKNHKKQSQLALNFETLSNGLNINNVGIRVKLQLIVLDIGALYSESLEFER
jgi:hypothetical protein